MVHKKTVGSIVEPPSATQLENIRMDNNEPSDEKLRHSERLMHEWIRSQGHFPKDIDRGFIRAFLRGSKHNLERARRKLEQNLSAKHLYPEIYANRSPLAKEIVQAMDVVTIAALPNLTTNGYRVTCFGLNRYDPAEFNPTSIVKLYFMSYELLISSETPFAGDIAIFDANHFGAGHVAKWFGSFFRVLEKLLREAYAMRLKQIHVINAPSVLAKMVNVIKPLLHPKVRNSVYIHSDSKNLLEFFGPENLPADYSGNLKPIRKQALEWYDVINDNAEWFNNQEHVKITGIPKRVKSVLYFKDNFGVEGSFRKLEID